MAELTVLRVEVVNVGDEVKGGLAAGKGNVTKGLGIGGSRPSSEKLDSMAKMKGHFFGSKGVIEKDGTILPINKQNEEEAKGIDGAKVLKSVTAVATTAAAVYTLASNYKRSGLEMSGATHAAAIQGRTTDALNTGVTLGIAFAINPALAAAALAMKAYQLAQTNRKELFEIQKNLMVSQLLQRNLVKTVAERRF